MLPATAFTDDNDKVVEEHHLRSIASKINSLTSASMQPPGTAALALEVAIDVNRRLQEVFKQQLTAVDSSLHFNEASQSSIRLRVAEAQKNRRAALRQPGNHQPMMRPRRVPGKPFFEDNNGEHPPRNPDAQLRHALITEKMPLVFTTKKWSKEDREKLHKGVRSLMQKIIVEQAMDNPEMSSQELEQTISETAAMNFEELSAHKDGTFSNEDWEQIVLLGEIKHSAAACRVQWETVDHPSIRHPDSHPWQKEEECRLLELARLHEGYNWQQTAAELDSGRTPAACFIRYQQTLNKNLLRSTWDKEEDKQLAEAVRLYGTKNWQQVAACLKQRSAQQCQFRWCKSLDPKIVKGKWDSTADARLRMAVQAYGCKNWNLIREHVPGRSDA